MTEVESRGDTRVLVTGASGYLGIHCTRQLLEEGYTVRGTVRDANNAFKVQPLKDLKGSEKLELVTVDLLDEKGWPVVVKDCTYILHVASPFPLVADDSVISTAINGTMNVLRAASKESSVKKVILTSSSAAIHEGHNNPNHVFNENDWSNLDSKSIMNYSKSKTLAEKAAWDFMKNEDVKFKLTVINPTLIVGPVIHDVQGSSIAIVLKFLNHEMLGLPALQLGLVDVRDVALAHTKAMREPKSDGERILVTWQPSFWFRDIANTLRKEFGPQGYWLPRFEVPYAFVWLYSFFDGATRDIVSRVGQKVEFDNSKAKRLLGLNFIDPHVSLVKMAYDLIDRGMVKKKGSNHGSTK